MAKKPEISIAAVRARSKAKGYNPTDKQVRATYNRDVARRQKGSKAKLATAPMQRPVTKKQMPAARPVPHNARPSIRPTNAPPAPAPTTKKVRPTPTIPPKARRPVGRIVVDSFQRSVTPIGRGLVKKPATRRPVMPKRGS